MKRGTTPRKAPPPEAPDPHFPHFVAFGSPGAGGRPKVRFIDNATPLKELQMITVFFTAVTLAFFASIATAVAASVASVHAA